MKQKISITVDEDLVKWINTQPDFDSASEFVNFVLRKEFSNASNIWSEISKLEYQRYEIRTKENELIKQLSILVEEGNKKEREEAELKLIELKEKREQERKKHELIMEDFKKALIGLGTIAEFYKCECHKDIVNLFNKMGKLNFEKGLYNLNYGWIPIICNNLETLKSSQIQLIQKEEK